MTAAAETRCGLTLRFTTPDVIPAKGDANAVQWKADLVRGTDRYGHFEVDPPPQFVAQAKASAASEGA